MKIEGLWYADADIRAPIYDACADVFADAEAYAAAYAADAYAADDAEDVDAGEEDE